MHSTFRKAPALQQWPHRQFRDSRKGNTGPRRCSGVVRRTKRHSGTCAAVSSCRSTIWPHPVRTGPTRSDLRRARRANTALLSPWRKLPSTHRARDNFAFFSAARLPRRSRPRQRGSPDQAAPSEHAVQPLPRSARFIWQWVLRGRFLNQNSTAGPCQALSRTRARDSANVASHQPSQALRPGRRRQKFSTALQRA